MSIALKATVKVSGVAPSAMLDKLGGEARNKAAAQSVSFLVQRHLTDYNRGHANQLGGKRTNFYRQLAQSTNWSADETRGIVAISDFRASQTIFGGTIKPGKSASFKSGKPTAALTIPASADSYGERAKKFDGKSVAIYFKVPHGKLLGMIVDRNIQRLGVGKVRREGAIIGGKLNDKGVFKFKRVLFWLVSEVTQRGRRDAIPSDQEITDGAIAGVRLLVQTVFRSGSGGVAVIT